MADPKYEVKDVRRVLAYLRDHQSLVTNLVLNYSALVFLPAP